MSPEAKRFQGYLDHYQTQTPSDWEVARDTYASQLQAEASEPTQAFSLISPRLVREMSPLRYSAFALELPSDRELAQRYFTMTNKEFAEKFSRWQQEVLAWKKLHAAIAIQAAFRGKVLRKAITVNVKTVYRPLREGTPRSYFINHPKEDKEALRKTVQEALKAAKANIIQVTINATAKGFAETVIGELENDGKERIDYLQFSPQIYEGRAKGGEGLYHPNQPGEFIKAMTGNDTLPASAKPFINAGYFNLQDRATPPGASAEEHTPIGPHAVPGASPPIPYLPIPELYKDVYYTMTFPDESITTTAPVFYDSKMGDLVSKETLEEQRFFKRQKSETVIPGHLTHLGQRNPRSGIVLPLEPGKEAAAEDKVRLIVSEMDHQRDEKKGFTGIEWKRLGEGLAGLNNSRTTFAMLDSGFTTRLGWMDAEGVHPVTYSHERPSPTYIVFDAVTPRSEWSRPYAVVKTVDTAMPPEINSANSIDQQAKTIIEEQLAGSRAVPEGKTKVATVILGQPGAGKSTLAIELATKANALMKEKPDEYEGVVTIDQDILRKKHVDYELALKASGETNTTAADLQKITSKWLEQLLSEATNDERNLLYVLVGQNPGPVVAKLRELKNEGYRIELRVIALHEAISRADIINRYEEERYQSGVGRRVDEAIHNTGYHNCVTTLKIIEQNKFAHSIVVIDRMNNIFYEKQLLDNNEWSNKKESAYFALKEARDVAISSKEDASYYERCKQTLVWQDLREASEEDKKKARQAFKQAFNQIEKAKFIADSQSFNQSTLENKAEEKITLLEREAWELAAEKRRQLAEEQRAQEALIEQNKANVVAAFEAMQANVLLSHDEALYENCLASTIAYLNPDEFAHYIQVLGYGYSQLAQESLLAASLNAEKQKQLLDETKRRLSSAAKYYKENLSSLTTTLSAVEKIEREAIFLKTFGYLDVHDNHVQSVVANIASRFSELTPDALKTVNASQLAILANSFSQRILREECREALVHMTVYISLADAKIDQWEDKEIAVFIDAFENLRKQDKKAPRNAYVMAIDKLKREAVKRSTAQHLAALQEACREAAESSPIIDRFLEILASENVAPDQLLEGVIAQKLIANETRQKSTLAERLAQNDKWSEFIKETHADEINNAVSADLKRQLDALQTTDIAPKNQKAYWEKIKSTIPAKKVKSGKKKASHKPDEEWNKALREIKDEKHRAYIEAIRKYVSTDKLLDEKMTFTKAAAIALREIEKEKKDAERKVKEPLTLKYLNDRFQSLNIPEETAVTWEQQDAGMSLPTIDPAPVAGTRHVDTQATIILPQGEINTPEKMTIGETAAEAVGLISTIEQAEKKKKKKRKKKTKPTEKNDPVAEMILAIEANGTSTLWSRQVNLLKKFAPEKWDAYLKRVQDFVEEIKKGEQEKKAAYEQWDLQGTNEEIFPAIEDFTRLTEIRDYFVEISQRPKDIEVARLLTCRKLYEEADPNQDTYNELLDEQRMKKYDEVRIRFAEDFILDLERMPAEVRDYIEAEFNPLYDQAERNLNVPTFADEKIKESIRGSTSARLEALSVLADYQFDIDFINTEVFDSQHLLVLRIAKFRLDIGVKLAQLGKLDEMAIVIPALQAEKRIVDFEGIPTLVEYLVSDMHWSAHLDEIKSDTIPELGYEEKKQLTLQQIEKLRNNISEKMEILKCRLNNLGNPSYWANMIPLYWHLERGDDEYNNIVNQWDELRNNSQYKPDEVNCLFAIRDMLGETSDIEFHPYIESTRAELYAKVYKERERWVDKRELFISDEVDTAIKRFVEHAETIDMEIRPYTDPVFLKIEASVDDSELFDKLYKLMKPALQKCDEKRNQGLPVEEVIIEATHDTAAVTLDHLLLSPGLEKDQLLQWENFIFSLTIVKNLANLKVHQRQVLQSSENNISIKDIIHAFQIGDKDKAFTYLNEKYGPAYKSYEWPSFVDTLLKDNDFTYLYLDPIALKEREKEINKTYPYNSIQQRLSIDLPRALANESSNYLNAIRNYVDSNDYSARNSAWDAVINRIKDQEALSCITAIRDYFDYPENTDGPKPKLPPKLLLALKDAWFGVNQQTATFAVQAKIELILEAIKKTAILDNMSPLVSPILEAHASGNSELSELLIRSELEDESNTETIGALSGALAREPKWKFVFNNIPLTKRLRELDEAAIKTLIDAKLQHFTKEDKQRWHTCLSNYLKAWEEGSTDAAAQRWKENIDSERKRTGIKDLEKTLELIQKYFRDDDERFSLPDDFDQALEETITLYKGKLNASLKDRTNQYITALQDDPTLCKEAETSVSTKFAAAFEESRALISEVRKHETLTTQEVTVRDYFPKVRALTDKVHHCIQLLDQQILFHKLSMIDDLWEEESISSVDELNYHNTLLGKRRALLLQLDNAVKIMQGPINQMKKVLEDNLSLSPVAVEEFTWTLDNWNNDFSHFSEIVEKIQAQQEFLKTKTANLKDWVDTPIAEIGLLSASDYQPKPTLLNSQNEAQITVSETDFDSDSDAEIIPSEASTLRKLSHKFLPQYHDDYLKLVRESIQEIVQRGDAAKEAGQYWASIKANTNIFPSEDEFTRLTTIRDYFLDHEHLELPRHIEIARLKTCKSIFKVLRDSKFEGVEKLTLEQLKTIGQNRNDLALFTTACRSDIEHESKELRSYIAPEIEHIQACKHGPRGVPSVLEQCGEKIKNAIGGTTAARLEVLYEIVDGLWNHKFIEQERFTTQELLRWSISKFRLNTAAKLAQLGRFEETATVIQALQVEKGGNEQLPTLVEYLVSDMHWSAHLDEVHGNAIEKEQKKKLTLESIAAWHNDLDKKLDYLERRLRDLAPAPHSGDWISLINDFCQFQQGDHTKKEIVNQWDQLKTNSAYKPKELDCLFAIRDLKVDYPEHKILSPIELSRVALYKSLYEERELLSEKSEVTLTVPPAFEKLYQYIVTMQKEKCYFINAPIEALRKVMLTDRKLYKFCTELAEEADKKCKKLTDLSVVDNEIISVISYMASAALDAQLLRGLEKDRFLQWSYFKFSLEQIATISIKPSEGNTISESGDGMIKAIIKHLRGPFAESLAKDTDYNYLYRDSQLIKAKLDEVDQLNGGALSDKRMGNKLPVMSDQIAELYLQAIRQYISSSQPLEARNRRWNRAVEKISETDKDALLCIEGLRDYYRHRIPAMALGHDLKNWINESSTLQQVFDVAVADRMEFKKFLESKAGREVIVAEVDATIEVIRAESEARERTREILVKMLIGTLSLNDAAAASFIKRGALGKSNEEVLRQLAQSGTWDAYCEKILLAAEKNPNEVAQLTDKKTPQQRELQFMNEKQDFTKKLLNRIQPFGLSSSAIIRTLQAEKRSDDQSPTSTEVLVDGAQRGEQPDEMHRNVLVIEALKAKETARESKRETSRVMAPAKLADTFFALLMQDINNLGEEARRFMKPELNNLLTWNREHKGLPKPCYKIIENCLAGSIATRLGALHDVISYCSDVDFSNQADITKVIKYNLSKFCIKTIRQMVEIGSPNEAVSVLKHLCDGNADKVRALAESQKTHDPAAYPTQTLVEHLASDIRFNAYLEEKHKHKEGVVGSPAETGDLRARKIQLTRIHLDSWRKNLDKELEGKLNHLKYRLDELPDRKEWSKKIRQYGHHIFTNNQKKKEDMDREFDHIRASESYKNNKHLETMFLIRDHFVNHPTTPFPEGENIEIMRMNAYKNIHDEYRRWTKKSDTSITVALDELAKRLSNLPQEVCDYIKPKFEQLREWIIKDGDLYKDCYEIAETALQKCQGTVSDSSSIGPVLIQACNDIGIRCSDHYVSFTPLSEKQLFDFFAMEFRLKTAQKLMQLGTKDASKGKQPAAGGITIDTIIESLVLGNKDQAMKYVDSKYGSVAASSNNWSKFEEVLVDENDFWDEYVSVNFIKETIVGLNNANNYKDSLGERLPEMTSDMAASYMDAIKMYITTEDKESRERVWKKAMDEKISSVTNQAIHTCVEAIKNIFSDLLKSSDIQAEKITIPPEQTLQNLYENVSKNIDDHIKYLLEEKKIKKSSITSNHLVVFLQPHPELFDSLSEAQKKLVLEKRYLVRPVKDFEKVLKGGKQLANVMHVDKENGLVKSALVKWEHQELGTQELCFLSAKIIEDAHIARDINNAQIGKPVRLDTSRLIQSLGVARGIPKPVKARR